MGPIRSIKTCLAKSFQFSGRASRSEFWWFTLILIIVLVGVLLLIDISALGFDFEGTAAYAPVADTLGLLTLPAGMAATARRLRDLGLPGWPAALALVATYATSFIPTTPSTTFAVGLDWISYVLSAVNLAVLFIAAFPSTPGPNRYGPPPSEVTP